MKYLKYFLVSGIIFMVTSSHTTRTSELSVGVNPGNLIPDFIINDESGNKLNLSSFKGQKLLVSFWAAYDADSHMKNVLLWNTLQKENFNFRMISISFDKSESIFKKTLNADGISSEFNFLDLNGSNSEIYQKCQLAKGFNNYLLDENGVIIAVNITPEYLKTITN